MKVLGGMIFSIGLILGVFAISMDVGVDVQAKDYGYGISSPAMRVANVDLISKRQNFLIFSGVLTIAGAILMGFGGMANKQENNGPSHQASKEEAKDKEVGSTDELKTAIFNNDINKVKQILASGRIDPNESNGGMSPIEYALMHERKDIVEILHAHATR